MNALLQGIHMELFRHDSPEQTTIEEINEFVRRYPFSAIGRLLAATDSNAGSSTIQTAGLYLQDPLVLNLLLSKTPEKTTPVLPTSNQGSENRASVTAEIATEEQRTIAEVNDTESAPEPEPKAEEEIPMKIPALVMPEVTLSPGQEFSFEPYHTVDYFASQGIRLRKEDLENDQFGKQLRSFTDWLRSMKKIEPVTIENQPASPAEDTIKKHAAVSIEESDVETEAMAEVWIKQGKTARAMAIYKKLSLLNPSKSHYFAAKIEQLKDL